MIREHHTLAIDFGTCYSSAARMVDGRAEAIMDPLVHQDFVPSSALLTTQDELLVGWPAKRRQKSHPKRYRAEFKRELGNRVRLALGEREYAPEELALELIAYLKRGAEKATGQTYEHAVLTYPSSYDEHGRDLMRNIGTEAGFRDVELLEEPVAAVIGHAGSDPEPTGRTVLVYDLGGGTFDAALVVFEGESHEVLGSDGIKHGAGGTDFDRAIERHLIEVGGEQLTELLSKVDSSVDSERTQGLQALAIAREFCNHAKHELSERETFEDDLVLAAGPPLQYRLTRDELEAFVADSLDSTLTVSRGVLTHSGVSPDQVDGVLMVGGSCRLPFIERRLQEAFDRPVWRMAKPELAVCQGASVWVRQAAEAEDRRIEEERNREQDEREARVQAKQDADRQAREREAADNAKREREAKRAAATARAANQRKLQSHHLWASFPDSVQKRLLDELSSGEEVLLFAKCQRSEDWSENTGLLLTSERVLWARSSLLSGLQSESIPLSRVSRAAVDVLTAPAKQLLLSLGERTQIFWFFREPAAAQQIAELIRARKGEHRSERRRGHVPLGRDTPIDELGIPVRARVALNEAGFETAGDVVARSVPELASVEGIGLRLAQQILELLDGMAQTERGSNDVAVTSPAGRLAANRGKLVRQPAWRKASDALRSMLIQEITGNEDVLEVAGFDGESEGILIVTSARVVWARPSMDHAGAVDLEAARRAVDSRGDTLTLQVEGHTHTFASLERSAEVLAALGGARHDPARS